MLLTDLLTSLAVQEFIQNAIKKKMDALQISTALNKAGYSNEDRAAIMDYMALVPKFREKFFGEAGKKSDKFLLCDRLALEQSTAQDIGRYKANLWIAGLESQGQKKRSRASLSGCKRPAGCKRFKFQGYKSPPPSSARSLLRHGRRQLFHSRNV